MLLDAEGNMRLCDFGLAYQFQSENEFLKNTAGTDSYNGFIKFCSKSCCHQAVVIKLLSSSC